MADFLSAEQLRKVRREIESGKSAYEVAKRYGIDKSNILRRIKLGQWSPRFPAVERAIEASEPHKTVSRRDDAVDQHLVRRHAEDWKTLRLLVQKAIDSGRREDAEHARACADAVQVLHAGETRLRSLVSRGRLRARALSPAPALAPHTLTSEVEKPLAARRGPAQALGPVPHPLRDMDALFAAWQESGPHTARSTIAAWGRMVAKFAAFVGHKDPTAVSRPDVLRWRDALVASGMSRVTVQTGYISAPRAIWQFGVDNLLIPENPFRAVTMRIRTNRPRPHGRSKGFSQEEARQILRATRAFATIPGSPGDRFRRWAPWLMAFSGARVGEIAQLRRSEIVTSDGIVLMRLTPSAGSIKGKMPRDVPLHPQLVQEGFLDFVAGAPGSYLFGAGESRAGLTSRAGQLAAMVRRIGVSDSAVSPNHGWRHRFKTLCRGAGIAAEYHDAITGHRSRRSVGETYGEYPPAALHREISKLPWIRL